MCGIIAYIGKKKLKDILLAGLRSLEYRGYDSSGIAFLKPDLEVGIKKTVGKISNLEKDLEDETTIMGNCGIGHTRWATHGEANSLNAHPHCCSLGKIALVHNGIIKNYFSLKEKLISEGFEFKTDTDTEVIVHLFSKYKKDQEDDLEVLKRVIKDLEGSYAIAILIAGSSKILVAKNESPLVIGIGDCEHYVASDSSTVLHFTDRIIKLQDKQIAEISCGSVDLRDSEGKKVKVEIHRMVQSASILEKGEYKHFLLKEIHEQPVVISHMLQSVLADPKNIACFNNLIFDLKSIKRVVFTACGSAYHSALIGKVLIEAWVKIPVEVEIASEFIDKDPVVGPDTLIIGVSQSGETADTLAAIKKARLGGAKSIAITNKVDSAIVDLCAPCIYLTPAGNEVSVASTKAFTSQVLSMYFLALKLAQVKGSLEQEKIEKYIHELKLLPQLLDQVIQRSENFRDKFLKYSGFRDFLFLSRGINYPIALEGALKLKELSYIHATGYPSGEMKHGPIAILDQNVPVLSIAINGKSEAEKNIYSKILHNAQEARTRKSPSLVIASDSDTEVDSIFDEIIRIPNISQIFSPIVATIPLQFLAYFIAEDLGKDVDQPRNLAKSVTVE
jgi:glutamine---fructose-6-phosphate transaminase (isomerizing)